MQRIRSSRPVTLALTTDVTSISLRARLALSLAVVALYVPAFVLLQARVGPVAAALGLIPAIAAGWFLGRRGGLAIALLVLAANTATFMSDGAYDPRPGLPGIAMLFVGALVAGWMRSIYIGARRRAEGAEVTRELSERMSRELRRSYESLDAVLESAPLQLAQIDARGVITSFRGSPLVGLDVSPEDLVGRSLLELRADHPEVPDLIRRALLGETVVAAVSIGERREHFCLTPILGAEGNVRGVNAVSLDVTERERALEEARRLASTDHLTGLANRGLLIERGTAALASPGAAVCVLALDLDGFRELNAALGHETGDEVLRIVGKRLSSTFPATDTVARFGGNSFVVLVLNVRPDQVTGIVRRVQAAFERPIEIDGNALEVGLSIGSACGPDGAVTFDAVLHHAELAMHEAKDQRVGHVPHSADLTSANRERVTLMADLRRALEQDQLELEYQPIVSLADGRTVGTEALLRWRHPVRGNVPPSDFIPFVERSVLGRRLSRWVLRRMWHDTRTLGAIAGPLKFAVNLSARDLADQEILGEIKALCARIGTSGTLMVEITESDVMADPERAIEALGALRATGVRVAIDDFGTGYSSLAYLHRLPADELKIDRSFVSRIASDEKARLVVRATIAIGHALGLKVVAEGAEDEATLEILRSLGCDRVQGWAIARAMPVERLAAWLLERPAVRPRLQLLGPELLSSPSLQARSA